jgi:hypothetical protein
MATSLGCVIQPKLATKLKCTHQKPVHFIFVVDIRGGEGYNRGKNGRRN